MSQSLERLYLDTISGARRGFGASVTRAALTIAELPYSGMMRLRNALFHANIKKAVDLRRFTVSVGNITAGGTGKTPVVRWLCSRLLADNILPAVLMRGYTKGETSDSDEAELLRRALGPRGIVQVGADRAGSAEIALAEHPAIGAFVLDDGFQHRRAKRDFDIVLVNAAEPFGYGHVHPRGLLREPITGLSRANAIVITHASRAGQSAVEDCTRLIRANTSAPIYQCDHVLAGLRGATTALSDPIDEPIESLVQRPFFAIAGIGHPSGFEAQLRGLGDRFVGYRWFGDHHAYSADDVQSVIAAATAAGAQSIVTTEKDWTKLAFMPQVRSSPMPFVRADLSLRFAANDEQALYTLVVTEMRARQ